MRPLFIQSPATASRWRVSAERTPCKAETSSDSSRAEQPVAANSTEAGRALNRRVEMAPVPKASSSASTAKAATRE